MAVSATAVPYATDVLQDVPGQLMPDGVEVTDPEPVTETVTVSVLGTNWAVTATFEFTVRLQMPVPVQAPPAA